MKLRPHEALGSSLEKRIFGYLESDFFEIDFPIKEISLSVSKEVARLAKAAVDESGGIDFDDLDSLKPFRKAVELGVELGSCGRFGPEIAAAVADQAFEACRMTAYAQKDLFPADPAFEIEAIVRYVEKTWDCPDGMDEALRFAWAQSLRLSYPAFESHLLADVADARLTSDFAVPLLTSGITLSHIATSCRRYDDTVPALVEELAKLFPSAKAARPKGWKHASKGYSDYDGMEEFDGPAARREFGGMDSGTAGCSGFETRISLPHVLYDDKCQGRKPIESLVGAVYGHAYVLNSRNNSLSLAEEMNELAARSDAGFDWRLARKEARTPHARALLELMTKHAPNPEARAREVLEAGPRPSRPDPKPPKP